LVDDVDRADDVVLDTEATELEFVDMATGTSQVTVVTDMSLLVVMVMLCEAAEAADALRL